MTTAPTDEQIDLAARAICTARGLDPDAPFTIIWNAGLEDGSHFSPSVTNAMHFRELAQDILAVTMLRDLAVQ